MTVYKYDVPMSDHFSLPLPRGAEVLTVQLQYGYPRVWVRLNPKGEIEPRHLWWVGTGHDLPDADLRYIGTIQLSEGELVFHLFEEKQG